MSTALLVNEVVVARKYEHPQIPEDASLDDSFRLIMGNVLDHICANIEPAEQGDLEGIHQLRIGIRRARAALRLYRSVLPINMFTRFDRRLRNFGRAFGEARDWDVLITETARSDWPKIAEVRKRCAQQQRQHRSHVKQMLTVSPHFSNLVERMGVWANATQFEDVRIIEDPKISAMAPKMLAELAAKVEKRRKKARAGDTDSLHRLRKSAKWLRYATEFVGGLYGRKKVKRYLASVKQAMDQLGTINDAVVAERLLHKIDLFNAVRPALDTHRKHTLRKAPDALTNFKLKAFWS